MERVKTTSFLLILSSSFLMIFLIILPTTISRGNKADVSETPLSLKNNNFFPKDTQIILTGDIMLGRSVMDKTLNVDDSYYPFRKVADTLNSADLVFANLENPIVKDCPKHIGGFKFCTTYEIAEGLVFSGIDVVNIANNHTLNYGREGFEETKDYLTDKGIDYVGDDNLVVKEENGTKFGFLGFDYTISTQNIKNDIELIRNSDGLVDVLIVGVHWGEEYKDTANLFQEDIAKEMIEAGADVISGHHPHWVQNIEEINGKPVFYSLGNFIFDQMWSEETKKGIMVKLSFTEAEITNTEVYDTYIKYIGQPEIIN